MLRQPCVIGGGRVGTAIARMHPCPVPVLGRGERVPDDAPPLPPAAAQQLAALLREHAAPLAPSQHHAHQQTAASTSAPIWVCTTNDGCDAALAATPPARRRDLVWIQNGMLLPWLHAHGLGGNTQVLLYMAANADGSVTDGKLTLVHGGPWAHHAAALLRAGGVTARVEPDWRRFQDATAAKLLWAAIFWMLSAALGGATVGHIAEAHAADVEALVGELLPLADSYVEEVAAARGGGGQQAGAAEEPGQAAAAAAAAGAAAGASSGGSAAAGASQQQAQRGEERVAEVTAGLLSYSRSIAAAVPSRDMALREWAWRNGWLLRRGRTPLHVAWLRRAGCGYALLGG